MVVHNIPYLLYPTEGSRGRYCALPQALFRASEGAVSVVTEATFGGCPPEAAGQRGGLTP